MGGKVVTLTELNFDQQVATGSGETWMIDIFAPWCPACQEMEAAWAQLAEELSADGIRVGKVQRQGAPTLSIWCRLCRNIRPTTALCHTAPAWVHPG